MSHSYISEKIILTYKLDQSTSGMKMSLFFEYSWYNQECTVFLIV